MHDTSSRHEPPRGAVADAGILGRLLLLQTNLHVMPGVDGVGEFLCQGLLDVPGVTGTAVCIGGHMVGRSRFGDECDRHAVAHSCEELLAAAEHASCADCPLARPPLVRRLPFSTISASYGWLLIALDDEGAFAPYSAHVQNLANLIAIILENRRQQMQLVEGQRELARKVEERTLELSRANEELAQARKLESIGQLAGGIAHDFNNLLTAILGYTELAQSLEPEEATADCLREIRAAGERAADLTGQLLAFARRQVLAPRPLAPNRLIGDLAGMLRRLIGEHIRLTTRLAPEPWCALLDAGQFAQLLTNLAVNARDAMPAGGTLTIETKNLTFRAEDVERPPAMEPGDAVAITVTDSGVGMTEEVRLRAFEPFFTTKPVGHGTGLGLSTCYGIVRQSGGDMRVTSQPGQGTTFVILFPRAGEGEGTCAGHASATAAAAAGRQETILLVEDEPAIRRLAARTLHAAGYRVLEAANGREAGELVDRHAGRLDAVVTDIVMPEIGGPALVASLRQRGHRPVVLYVSGYPNADVHLDATAEAFLAKPFAPAALLSGVRTLLDRS